VIIVTKSIEVLYPGGDGEIPIEPKVEQEKTA